MNKFECLTVERMPHGGFVVIEGVSRSDYNRQCGPLFACSAIGDALAFVRDKLDPAATSAAAGARIGGNLAGAKFVKSDKPTAWSGY